MARAGYAAAIAAAVVLATASVASAQQVNGPLRNAAKGWYVLVEATYLQRSRPDNSGAIVAANPAGTSFHNGSDFDFNPRYGWEIVAGKRVNPEDSLEFRYLESRGHQDDYRFFSPGNFIGYGFTGPGGTQFDTTVRTDLASYEATAIHQAMSRFSFLAGLRAIRLNDYVVGHLNTNVAHGLYKYDNRLTGGQVGASVRLFDPMRKFQVTVTGKAGVFGNNTSGGIYEFQGATFIGSFENKRYLQSSTAAELDVNASLKLGNHVILHAGYELLWINGVALGTNAASFSLLNPSLLRGRVPATDIVFQGAKAGVEITW